MTDATTGAPPPIPPTETQPGQVGIRILAQFLRDLSFESPRAPESLRGVGAQPQIELAVELNVKGRDDGLYEVEIKLKARAAREADTVFVIEVAYAGLFEVMGVPQADLEPVLMIECPRYLFPFVRRTIADLSTEGGFPPFMLEPIDFAGIYAARQAQSQGMEPGNA
jgi:preprotein translocase subunit SecB